MYRNDAKAVQWLENEFDERQIRYPATLGGYFYSIPLQTVGAVREMVDVIDDLSAYAGPKYRQCRDVPDGGEHIFCLSGDTTWYSNPTPEQDSLSDLAISYRRDPSYA